ncbi:unnamed protein product, partial [Cyprideis torosa]
CTLQVDPTDPCCKISVCGASSSDIADENLVVSPYDDPVGANEADGSSTAAIFDLEPPEGSTTAIAGCTYDGRTYAVGEHFEKGCNETCLCLDVNLEHCNRRCPELPPSPTGSAASGAWCIITTDPADYCCRVWNCTKLSGPEADPTDANGDLEDPANNQLPAVDGEVTPALAEPRGSRTEE